MNCTEISDGSFVTQVIPNVTVDAQIYMSLQYADMTAGLQGEMVVLGYVNGEAVDAAGGGFTPAGAGYATSSFRWDARVQAFDSLYVMIAVSPAGEEPVFGSVIVDDVVITGINGQGVDKGVSFAPVQSAIESIYPNPFNSDATIRYTSPTSGKVSIFDVSGRLVGRVGVGASTGISAVRWSNIAGKSLPAGRYTIMLNAGGQTTSATAIYLK